MVTKFRIVGILCVGFVVSSLHPAVWKPVEGHIMTPWAKDVDPAKTLPD